MQVITCGGEIWLWSWMRWTGGNTHSLTLSSWVCVCASLICSSALSEDRVWPQSFHGSQCNSMAKLPEGVHLPKPAAVPSPCSATHLQVSLNQTIKWWNLEPVVNELQIRNFQSFIQILSFHGYRLYKGTLVHHLIQRMMSGKLKNFLKKDLSRVNKYKTMLAAVRQFDSQQPRRRRAFHQGHQPRVKEIVVDVWRLYDRQEEAAAVRALKDIHLEHMVSLKVRHTAKDKRKSTSNLMMVCKSERRGKDLIWFIMSTLTCFTLISVYFCTLPMRHDVSHCLYLGSSNIYNKYFNFNLILTSSLRSIECFLEWVLFFVVPLGNNIINYNCWRIRDHPFVLIVFQHEYIKYYEYIKYFRITKHLLHYICQY